MTKLNLVVATHGSFGAELTRSAEMIVGKTVNVYSLSLLPDKSFENFLAEANEIFETISGPTIALVDLFGGTPSNVLTALTKKYQHKVVTGVNLPMFIDLYMKGTTAETIDLDAFVESCFTVAKESVVLTNELLLSEGDYKMFEGIITPIVTPFHRDPAETINYEAMENLVDHLIEKGVSGIFPLGSNGEFHVLNSEEKMAFSKAVIDHVAKRVPVYIGTGACSTKETIELSQKAESLGADALSVITPYFITPSDEEILQHYQKVANSVQIPIILYNIPKNTGCNISKEVLRELTKLPNVLGIKDSSGDLNNLKDYLEVTEGTKVNVLVGSDSKILAGYKLGASGAIAGTSNLITETIVSLDQAIRGNNWESAEKLQNDIEELRGALKLGTVPSILKRAIELAAIAEVGPARRPEKETTASDDRKILSMIKYYNLID